jgi:hypothetical protein
MAAALKTGVASEKNFKPTQIEKPLHAKPASNQPALGKS